MMYVIFDTETTDLRGEVIQLSYMLINDVFEVVDFKSFYCDTNARITQGAFEVHGINEKTLEVLSGGKFLEDYLIGDSKMKSIFIDGTGYVFMGYNVKFDIERVNQTLLASGTSMTAMIETKSLTGLSEAFSYSYDIMGVARSFIRSSRNIKLSQATEVITKVVNPDLDIECLYEIYKENFNLSSRGGTYHDASYDVFCTYLLLLSLNR